MEKKRERERERDERKERIKLFEEWATLRLLNGSNSNNLLLFRPVAREKEK